MSDSLSPGVPPIGDMKSHLQILLDNKEKELQQAGTLGQRILSQQIQLEERVRQLYELEEELGDNQDFEPEVRKRYGELMKMVKAWDAHNTQLTQWFGPKPVTNGIPSQASSRAADNPRGSGGSKGVSSAAARPRRSKNRADDVEFAFEIGSGLLGEVRRLQGLIGERDRVIQNITEEKDDLNKTIESLRSGLRAQEQNADRLEEENWNLEVTLQELRALFSDSQVSTQRLEPEQTGLTKRIVGTREGADQTGAHTEGLGAEDWESESEGWELETDDWELETENEKLKIENEKLKATLNEFKAKHETDITQARPTMYD